MTKQKRGWIVFSFEKPIIIRGYGLCSATTADVSKEECQKDDPSEWTFMISDAIPMLSHEDI